MLASSHHNMDDPDLREDIAADTNVTVVTATWLRHHKIYESMYRLMAELLIFKVTPWVSFLVLFLTIRSRIR